MKAIELKQKYLKKKEQDKVSVVAVDIKKGFSFHVHDDEEIPHENTYYQPPTFYSIYLHPRLRATPEYLGYMRPKVWEALNKR